MSDFTPGPWRGGMSSVLVKNRKTGAWCKFAGYHGRAVLPQKEARANLRLAAAAPDLLDALQRIEEYWNQDQNETAMADACWHAINTARAAIARATGEQP